MKASDEYTVKTVKNLNQKGVREDLGLLSDVEPQPGEPDFSKAKGAESAVELEIVKK